MKHIKLLAHLYKKKDKIAKKNKLNISHPGDLGINNTKRVYKFIFVHVTTMFIHMNING